MSKAKDGNLIVATQKGHKSGKNPKTLTTQISAVQNDILLTCAVSYRHEHSTCIPYATFSSTFLFPTAAMQVYYFPVME